MVCYDYFNSTLFIVFVFVFICIGRPAVRQAPCSTW